MSDKELEAVFYSPQVGLSGVDKIADKTKKDPEHVREWLGKQKIYQLHRPHRKRLTTHFNETQLNELHQADVMFFPTDGDYSYILTLVDAATRYKAAEKLKTKAADEVKAAFEKIYSKPPLKPPKKLMVDEGSEFKGVTQKYFEKHGTLVRRAEPGHHRSQAFVESFNRYLQERLFKMMEVDEHATGKISRRWVHNLETAVAEMNSETTRMIGISPNEAVKQKTVAQPIQESDGIQIPLGSKVRLPLTAEDQPGKRMRATDTKWTNKLYTVESHVVSDTNPTIYFVDGKKHGFTAPELQVVTEVDQPPVPEFVQTQRQQKLKSIAQEAAQKRAPKPKEERKGEAKVLAKPVSSQVPFVPPPDAPVWGRTRRGRAVRLPSKLRR